MEDGFADFSRMEVPPDDLLVNDFSDELFDMDDYLNELNELIPDNLDTGRFYLLYGAVTLRTISHW